MLTLPHSDAIYVKAYPAETAEAFCEGHVSAFAFFGGIPVSILYDNTRLARCVDTVYARFPMAQCLLTGRLQDLSDALLFSRYFKALHAWL